MVVVAKNSFDEKRNGYKKPVNNGISRFTEWKQRAVEMLLEDKELIKLLVYSTEDWNTRKDVSESDKYKLVNSQIFQYPYIDSIAQEQKSYIGLGISNLALDEGFRRFSYQYISGYLYFHVICDRQIMNTNTGVRQDLIADRIYKIFSSNEKFGVGEINFATMYEKWVDNNSHGGYVMGFRITELKT